MEKLIVKFDDQPIIAIKEGNEIWFRAETVAKILGYISTRQATRNHVWKQDIIMTQVNSSPLTRNAKFINKAGIYSLIFGSKLESAKKFRNWVFHEVLPSIRKTGAYQLPKLKNNQMMLLNETDLHYQVVKCINYSRSWRTLNNTR